MWLNCTGETSGLETADKPLPTVWTSAVMEASFTGQCEPRRNAPDVS